MGKTDGKIIDTDEIGYLKEEVNRCRREVEISNNKIRMLGEQNAELERVVNKLKNLVVFVSEKSMDSELTAAHGARMAEAAAKR